jgi:hypothetical protein
MRTRGSRPTPAAVVFASAPPTPSFFVRPSPPLLAPSFVTESHVTKAQLQYAVREGHAGQREKAALKGHGTVAHATRKDVVLLKGRRAVKRACVLTQVREKAAGVAAQRAAECRAQLAHIREGASQAADLRNKRVKSVLKARRLHLLCCASITRLPAYA